MIKVLFLIPNLGCGGAEKVLVSLVNNIDKTKFDVTVHTLFDCGVNKENLNKDIKYKYFLKKQFQGNSTLMKIFSPKFLYKRIVKKEKYDILVSYLEGPTARIISGCTDDNVIKICWIHCVLNCEEVLAYPFRSIEEAKNCYNKFDKIVCVSEQVKDYFNRYIKDKTKTKVLYNTMETEKIKKMACESIEEDIFDKNQLNLISVGKISRVKGYVRLAKIHRELIRDGIKHKIYIVGEGEERKEIETFLLYNNLRKSFIFLGYKDNPYKYVKNADLFVCSSFSEGFSTAVAEALIIGTPVIATRCSGMDEMLGENNEYGAIVENDIDELYDGLIQILLNKEMIKAYAERALARGEIFNTKNTALKVQELFTSLIEEN